MAVRVSAALLMLAIFLLDFFTTLEGAVAVLYVVAVLLVARTQRKADIVLAGLGGIALTLVSYVDTHGLDHVGAQTVRALVSLAAVSIATVLALQSQAAVRTLTAQATLLDLSHDMIFVRDWSGAITFWNRTAEQVYGWSSEQAIGRNADELLGTHYPDRREDIEAELVRSGRWEGILEQVTRDGTLLTLDSRWVLQHDNQGRRVGVLETHTDITERKAAYAALVRSERRYRRMFDESRIGVLQQDWSAIKAELETRGLHDAQTLSAYLSAQPAFLGVARRLALIEDVNPAFAAMYGGAGEPSIPGSVQDVIGDDDTTFAGALLAFARGEPFHEGETEIVRSDGSRAPVLFAITFPSPDDVDASVLVFVIDITERKLAHDALIAAQSELAHASRVATLGEMTASIAHEVNQPLMAVVTYGEAGIRWLHRDPPDLDEARNAITRIVTEGRRAADIVQRIRAFLDKAPVRREPLHLATVVSDAARLVQHELARSSIDLRIDIQSPLPPLAGDRVQLQQVLVNLMINASQAMSAQDGHRLLQVSAAPVDGGGINLSVSDSGPGIPPEHIERLFAPFFTTKPQGMGMGLAICRTIVEAHGGALSVRSEYGGGATFNVSFRPTEAVP